jgi:hypothetical protein
MIYALDITTDANTAKTAPKVTQLPITKGLVYRFELTFPPGSMGLMGLRVFSGNFQIWPSNRDSWFRGDDSLIAFDDVYLVSSEPYLFYVITYNEDDTYKHEALLRIGLVSEDIFMARFLPSYAYEEYKKMLIELQQEQEGKRSEVLAKPFPWL